MRLAPLVVVCLLLPAPPVAATAPGAPNDSPLADAGLDRTVRAGDPVLLDAGGSLDPDGRLVRYEWRVETPDGGTVTPANPADVTTRFRPTTVGRYTVTLTVEDDGGATRTDALFVDVRARAATAEPAAWGGANDPPVGRLEGPRSVARGEAAAFRANVTDPDGRVAAYRWSTGGTRRTATGTFDRAAGTEVEVSVVVTDDDGASTRLNRTVRVVDNASGVRPPDARVDGPDRVAVGEPATYVLRGDDPDGEIARYEWEAPASETGPELTRAFADPGLRSVRGTVVDDDGATDTAATTVRVYAEGEPAAWLSGPDTAPAGSVRTYRVEAFDPDGGPVTASWSPNRSESGTGGTGSRFENRVRMPDEAGSVTVSVAVTDDEGESVTATRRVAVTPRGGAAPTDDADGGTPPLDVSDLALWPLFDESYQTSPGDTVEVGSYAASARVESASDGPLVAAWEFGDGAVKTETLDRTGGGTYASVRHAFVSENGGRLRVPVSVTVTDAAGNGATERVTRGVQTVAVHDRVNLSASTARWSATDGLLTVPAGTRVSFTARTAQSFRVEYGDGTVAEFPRTPSDTRFARVYDAPGTYTVQLTSSQGPNGYGVKRVTVRVFESGATGTATMTP